MVQLSTIRFQKGSYLLIEGKSDNDRFFIIQQGSVKIFHEIEVDDSLSSILGPGDFVGVVPCMSGHNQTESVVALTDVVAISVPKEQYTNLIATNTSVALKIITFFAHQMRKYNAILAKLTTQHTVFESCEQLFQTGLYYEKNRQFNIAAFAYYQYLVACKGSLYYEEVKHRFIKIRPLTANVMYETNSELQRNYPKNTMIFCESQAGHEMYIIQEGQVKISKVVDGNEVVLAILQKGDLFGEMALLENKPRSASAIANEDCKLMVVNRQNFDNMVATQPQLIYRLTTTLADRLWSMQRQLVNTLIKDPTAKMLDMLVIQLEKQKIKIMPKMSYQFNYTPEDIAKMCGIPLEETQCIHNFVNDRRVKLVQNKIFVADCYEVLKTSELFRKQILKS
ncbi:MAG: cyclic nucleotide-binding domain-containing protein [Spirochaetaceae bacterium]|nr:cyclic nucleotide-binding domain-containing protein [Spirochaetaceae bacterium]